MMLTRVPVPVLFLIDVEPDERIAGARHKPSWQGVEATFAYLTELRSRLAEITGRSVHYSWFLRMDPQIAHVYGTVDYVACQYERHWATAMSAGDTIGLHPHSLRWNDASGRWLADDADQAWVEHTVRSAFDAYRRRFGRACEAFRFGDRWLNDETVRLLEELGTRFDLTVEPGQPARTSLGPVESHTGCIPDYTAAPTFAYHPSAVDFRQADSGRTGGLWMIPLTTGRVRDWRSELLRVARRVASPASAPVCSHYTAGLSQHLFRVRDVIEQRLDTEWPYLTFVMRADVALHWRLRRHRDAIVNYLCRRATTLPMTWTTPSGASEHICQVSC